MLPKKQRARERTVEEIFKNGRFLNVPTLTFKFILGKSSKKISFVVPKSVAKTAVKRNLLRRRGYSALKNHFQSFPSGVTGVLVLKDKNATVLKIGDAIKEILAKLK